MVPYKPLQITGNSVGLVQNREEFLLPADAYPTLENAFVWRERIKRKQGYELLGRLRRTFLNQSLGTILSVGAGTGTLNIFTVLGIAVTQPNAQIQPGNQNTITITIGAPISQTLTDSTGTGVFTISPAGVITAATINYATGDLTFTFSGAAGSSAISFTGAYFPGLPVMGIRTRELNGLNQEMTVFWDTTYAYNFTGAGFVEFIPGTTWSGSLPNANSNFFWTTNYWVDDPLTTNQKIFWATNYSGTTGDPIRYTNGTGNGTGQWIDFAPQVNAAGAKLTQCLALLPFRGRLVAFNTREGPSLAASQTFTNRIRWAAIGTPFTTTSAIVPSTNINANAWRDDIRGQGGYLNMPTNQDIIAVGFVRDNLVIYCERSTWQLRYTGRAIAPFQIEQVNPELGTGSTFSAVRFDTSLVGVGDKGLVQCDSYKSDRIDIKIPDLVMEHFNTDNFGQKRVHGIRDFFQKLAFWTYPESDTNAIFPNRRLVYNYENDSWAIFTDSLTTLGTFQPFSSRTWANPTGGSPETKLQWQEANFTWGNKPSSILSIVGGNQQGYVEYLDSQTSNDESLFIQNITGNTTTPTVITSPNHNLETGAVISISSIPIGTPFAASLNGNVFGVVVITMNSFQLMKYDPTTGQFSDPQLDPPGVYIGGGQILVRDNFSIISKKFNFMDEGQNIQIGYIDILMNTSKEASISLNVFIDYDEDSPINVDQGSFFNTTIPTSATLFQTQNSSKTMQRVFCPTRGNFLTLQYTLSNSQMVGIDQENDVQIDSQVIWQRPAGRLGSI